MKRKPVKLKAIASRLAIAYLCESRDITRYRLSQLTEISEGTLCRYASGKVEMSLAVFTKLISELNLTDKEIITLFLTLINKR